MRFSVAVILAIAGLAVAQSTASDASGTTSAASSTSSGTGCNAENIVQACLSTTNVRVTSCGPNDYSCLCSAYTDQLTCYNNCPNDEGRSTVQSQVTANCVAASGLSAQSAAASTQSASATGSSGSSTGMSSVTTTESTEASSSTDSSTATAASESASSTGLANPVALPAGSVLALALGLFGIM